MSFWNEGKNMFSSKDCLKGINFALGQKLSYGVLQMPKVITQLSSTDQWSPPWMICLLALPSSFNVTRIHPRASKEALISQRSATISLRQTDLILRIRENNPSILIILITSVQVADGRPSAKSWNLPSIVNFQPRASRYSITIRMWGVSSFDHIAIVTLIYSDARAVTSNMNRYTNGGG
jgi:hypothetical protein